MSDPLGRTISAVQLEAYYETLVQEIPVQERELASGPSKVGVIEGIGTSEYLVLLPDEVSTETVTIRLGDASEGADAAVLIEGSWHKQEAAFFYQKNVGESDADVVERLGLPEEALLPHPYGRVD